MSNVRKGFAKEQHDRKMNCDDFVGVSGEMEEVRRLISLVASFDTHVLILGETGTGKELAAKAIHSMSPRRVNCFTAINSSSLQETMLESELFGYKKGAFTGAETEKVGLLEVAHQGTFFVDEVGDMGPTVQAKLLRALETGTFRKLGDTRETGVNVRFIFATNKDLKTEVEEDRFRKDLFYRINVFTINLPPLREKREDIPLLIDHFVDKFSRQEKRKWFSPEAMERLFVYDWPGNVRELANVVERAVIISGLRERMTVCDLPDSMLRKTSIVRDFGDHRSGIRVLTLRDAEERYIQRVLKLAGGNKTEAARLLDISRKSLYDKLRANESLCEG